MSVSANTLFHFTNFNSLLNIIKSKGFWPKYSIEHFKDVLPTSSNYLVAYIPMVCFCDLKLTQLSDTSISSHTKHFGISGIGLKKSWGIKNKISPVYYVHKNSIASVKIDNIIQVINQSEITNKKVLAENLGEVVKFLKPYQGKHHKGNEIKGKIIYYDEREWRYIPKETKFQVFPKADVNQSTVNQLNLALRQKPLTFSVDDIKYIIVASNKELQELAKRLDILKPLEATQIISKIITIKDIKEDF